MSDRKISICIPTFNRFEMTVNCATPVLNDDRVSEIIIVDDCSTNDSYEKLQWYFRDTYKVKLSRNATNIDCYFNKHKSVMKATNEYVGVWDSDNTFGMDYIDALFSMPDWDKKMMYQPCNAKPYFDFTKYSGLILTKHNVNNYLNTNLETMMNAANHFVNRAEYLMAWEGSQNPLTSDSIFTSFNWLKAGNTIKVTPDLTYQHYISPNNDGHYQTFSHLAVDFHKELLERFKNELK